MDTCIRPLPITKLAICPEYQLYSTYTPICAYLRLSVMMERQVLLLCQAQT